MKNIQLLILTQLFYSILCFSSKNYNSNYFAASSNQYNSNYFAASNNQYNSNYFATSLQLNSNNYMLTLIYSIYPSYSKQKTYSSSYISNNNNIFLSYINSVFYTSSHTLIKFSSPILTTIESKSLFMSSFTPLSLSTSLNTLAPTLSPTLAPTFIITISPSLKPSLVPTIPPTSLITIVPTLLVAPIISFNTKISFDNYNTNELDDKSKEVVIIATANSMNISDKYVEYIGSEIKNRRRLIWYSIKIQGYNIAIILQTNIPLEGKYATFINNPSVLYQTITTNLFNAVNTGTFTKFLQAASNGLNITSFSNSTILSIESDPFIIKDLSPKKDKKDKKYKTDVVSILYVLLFSFLLVCVIKLFYVLKERKWNISCIKNRGALTLQEISISNV
jgi:hypothetical protein